MKTGPGRPTTQSTEDGNTSGRRRAQGVPRWLSTALSLAALYVLLLLGFSRLAPLITVPDEAIALTPAGGGLGAAVHLLLGRPGGTDFLVDYASAYALVHHGDAYEIAEKLSERVGAPWPVSTANTHPPTMLPFILPFLAGDYGSALGAWSLAMLFVLILSVRFLEMPWAVAIGVGVALAVSFPGAYGIGNPVPLIGLGIAIAYRWRNHPLLAGLGIAIAAAPKISGILIVIPFLLSRRFKAVAVAAGVYGVMAGLPVLFQSNVWTRYSHAGVRAAVLNATRSDNASWLHLAEKCGVSVIVVIALLGVLTIVAAIITRDTFWPTVWLIVAALPIAWMYSLLTLVPLAVQVVRKGSPAAIGLIIAAAGLMIGSPPSAHWPVMVFPLVTVLAFIGLLLTRPPTDERFWLPHWIAKFAPARLSQWQSER